MIGGVGIDIVDVAKVLKLAREYPDKLGRVFTVAERRQGRGNFAKLAETFAAKEAVLKVLGTGWVSGLTWTDVEIPAAPASRRAKLRGGARKIASQAGIREIWVDTSCTKTKAVAEAIGIKK